MPKSRVQFQKGVSLAEFMERFGSEAQCEQALFEWRWPQGFRCPECGYEGYCGLHSRRLLQCHRCHQQTSLTSGTIFAATKLPLRVWFLAMYLLSQAKNGISGLELARSLGVSYNSAWLIKHKLMQVMAESESGRRLRGLVQLDDAYWGGRRRGGKRGRGARGKTPFIVAVQTDQRGRPRRARLSRLRAFRKREIARWSQRHLAAGSTVRSDGLSCFVAVAEADCTHRPLPTSASPRARRRLLWVDTVLGNVKNAMHGTYHAIRAKHLPRYLAEFCWRFNRRFDLASMLERLGAAAATTPPMPYRLVRLAEAHW
jgi:ISXO2-like transposase domain/Transposase zinc-ribbon domain